MTTKFPIMKPFEWDDLKVTAVPIHPQPGIYETTAGRDHYEAHREEVFGDLNAMRDAVTERLLDAGWTPSHHGCLVKPEPKGKVTPIKKAPAKKATR